MSLVAYDASSDEEENCESENNTNPTSKETSTNLNINDDDNINSIHLTKIISHFDKSSILQLPLPKFSLPDEEIEKIEIENETVQRNIEVQSDNQISIHSKLPPPKPIMIKDVDIIEEDDEFLHKKEISPEIPKPPKKPVKILVPSLDQFRDFSVEKKKEPNPTTSRTSSLLDLLPPPKTENFFSKNKETITSTKPTSTITRLIPDHVKHRLNQNKISTKTSSTVSLISTSDSEESDGEAADFFSLKSENKLPEISDNEIKAMVEKKKVELSQVSKKVDEMMKPVEIQNVDCTENLQVGPSVNKEAFTALVGASHAKRKKVMEDVQIVELTSEQILPKRDEWMRASIAAETTYQPRGLVDEEPAPGTRKKHQITYLAHQALANEAELQAMWAANRQNRRATASKYGF